MDESYSLLLARFQDLDGLWNPSDITGSEAAFRALLSEGEKLTGRDRSYLIDLHSLIGRSQAVQERFAEARSSLQTAEALLEALETGYPVSTRIRWLIEMGRLYILARTPAQAKGLFSEAWTL